MNDVDREAQGPGGAPGRGTRGEAPGGARVEDTRTGAYLTHFSPGGADLGEAHLRWLRGFASRVGTLTGDLYIVGLVDPAAGGPGGRALARRRARAVYRYLRSASRTFPFVDVHVTTSGRGIEGSGTEVAARNRGVALVHLAPGERGRGWLRAVVQEFPEAARTFYVRMLAGRAPSGGAGRGEEAGEAVPEAESESRVAFEINDGRWSALYELTVPPPRGPAATGGPAAAQDRGVGRAPSATRNRGAERGPKTALPLEPERMDAGPWHRFTSPFDLTVADFHRSPVMASGLFAPVEGVRLHLLRPPLTLAPFRVGGAMGLAALRAAIPVGTEVSPGGRVPLGRLDTRGREPFPRPIAAGIRHHLRRGGSPGPRSHEGGGERSGPED